MSYNSKIENAKNIIEEHNKNVLENQINFDDFLGKLKTMGGSSEDALMAVSWEDLQECGLPKIISRRLAHLFRQNSNDDNSEISYLSPKKVQSLSIKELIERYNPKDSKNSIGQRLQEISEGKPCIVFDDDGKVIVQNSVNLLEDIKNGFPEIETSFVNGRPFQVYKIGEIPDIYVDENPLYSGRALRTGEVCDQTGRSWEGIDTRIRQLLNIAISISEIKINNISDANDILDKILEKDCNFNTFRNRYPKSSKKFDEFSKIGQLPTLKIKLCKNSNKAENKNPRIF